MPTITLRSMLSTNTTTSVSLNEASFLAGVFSTSLVMSDFGLAQLAVDDAMAALANGTAAFVLPGVQIMVFPVGLVITGSWWWWWWRRRRELVCCGKNVAREDGGVGFVKDVVCSEDERL